MSFRTLRRKSCWHSESPFLVGIPHLPLTHPPSPCHRPMRGPTIIAQECPSCLALQSAPTQHSRRGVRRTLFTFPRRPAPFSTHRGVPRGHPYIQPFDNGEFANRPSPSNIPLHPRLPVGATNCPHSPSCHSAPNHPPRMSSPAPTQHSRGRPSNAIPPASSRSVLPVGAPNQPVPLPHAFPPPPVIPSAPSCHSESLEESNAPLPCPRACGDPPPSLPHHHHYPTITSPNPPHVAASLVRARHATSPSPVGAPSGRPSSLTDHLVIPNPHPHLIPNPRHL